MIRVEHGDMLDVLPRLAAEGVRVHAVVTDPPYHLTMAKRLGNSHTADVERNFTRTIEGQGANPFKLAARGFMGRKWDGGDIAFRPETWRLCWDLLPPGGYLLAFASTRTYHRIACAIEDAGFEIRDMLAWLYGSGFPKSLNVSKAIDKAAGATGGYGEAKTEAHKRYIEKGELRGDRGHEGWQRPWMDDPEAVANAGRQYLPGTDAARAWDGWGTSLKPSHEPVCIARKPLIGTVAANVLKYGTGALNIDKCRITTGQRPDEGAAWEHEQQLCDLCAGRAENTTKPGKPAIGASTATKPVEPTLSARDTTRPTDTDKTAIGCCDGTQADITATSSSTVASGQMQMGLSRPGTTSTMSTATKATTDSKTCSVCHVRLTPQNTRSSKHQPRNGQQMPQERGSIAGQIGLTLNGSNRNAQEGATSTIGSTPGARWPSNVCHDGSAEVVGAFPDSEVGNSRGIVGGNDANGRGMFGSNGSKPTAAYADHGSAARFFYSAKADAGDRLSSKHPTVKPVDLMRWLVRLVTPPGGRVLDPFAGSGTTGMACMAEGFDCVLVEREAEYVADIRRRIAHVSGADTPLFAETGRVALL